MSQSMKLRGYAATAVPYHTAMVPAQELKETAEYIDKIEMELARLQIKTTAVLQDLRELKAEHKAFVKKHAPEKVDATIWYMRDNHTFCSLPLDVEEAMKILRCEFDTGFTCGLLCSKHPQLLVGLNANGSDNWLWFKGQAREWLKNAINIIKGEGA